MTKRPLLAAMPLLVWLLALGTCHGRAVAQQITLPTSDPATIVADTGSQTINQGWANYLALWQRIASEPDAVAPRRLLGLPLSGQRRDRVTKPNRPPKGLDVARADLIRVQTSLITIDSTADPAATLRVARELHEAYWAWTQVFFPLWRSAPAICQSLESGIGDDAIGRRRLGRSPNMRIVLLRNASEYQSVLGGIDGISASTGFYDPASRCSYFYVGDETTLDRSRTHEWTHQLFAEATNRSRRDLADPVGEARDFWLVEGIAGYMESLTTVGLDDATMMSGGNMILGGWDSSRLQFARSRLVGGQPPIPLSRLRPMGRREAQGLPDLARWYGDSIAWTHFAMQIPEHRRWLLRQLADLYSIQTPMRSGATQIDPAVSDETIGDLADMQTFLAVDDQRLTASPTRRRITDLCLARCDISDAGLKAIHDGSQIRWLDLSGCDVSDDVVLGLIGGNSMLEQVDLTQTKIGDQTIAAIPADTIQVLYATATMVSDESIDRILAMKNLKQVDLQASRVSDEGIAKLRAARPSLVVNPLQIIRQ